MLSSLRKLFYESKTIHIDELNGETLFPDSVKNLDGSVQKETVLQNLLNCEQLSVTRLEVSQII
jgi:hypothetical protein